MKINIFSKIFGPTQAGGFESKTPNSQNTQKAGDKMEILCRKEKCGRIIILIRNSKLT